MKHTPGLWKAEHPSYLVKGLNHIYSSEQNQMGTDKIVASYVEEANAEFIVRACNSHDELLEACKEAEKLLRIGQRNNIFAECADKLQQAIAKVEGAIK